jgi:hypothetical protein
MFFDAASGDPFPYTSPPSSLHRRVLPRQLEDRLRTAAIDSTTHLAFDRFTTIVRNEGVFRPERDATQQNQVGRFQVLR